VQLVQLANTQTHIQKNNYTYTEIERQTERDMATYRLTHFQIGTIWPAAGQIAYKLYDRSNFEIK